MLDFGFVYHLLRFDGAKGEMKLVQSKATTVDQYLDELPPDRRETVAAVRDLVLENLPGGIRGNDVVRHDWVRRSF